MKLTPVIYCIVSTFFLSACANQDKLIFGQGNNTGLSISASAADTGASITLGYTGVDFAIVPVIVDDGHGGTKAIGGETILNSGDATGKSANAGNGSNPTGSGSTDKGTGNKTSAGNGKGGGDNGNGIDGVIRDSYSVFGTFGLNAVNKPTNPDLDLSKVFATGLAAKILAQGYARKLGLPKSAQESGGGDKPATDPSATQPKTQPVSSSSGKVNYVAATTPNSPSKSDGAAANKGGGDDSDCNPPSFESTSVSARTTNGNNGPGTESQPGSSSPASSGKSSGGSTASSGRAYSLIFAQYENIGISLSFTATGQGADFTLGSKDRNLAIVPVVQRNDQGEPEYLEASGRGALGTEYDALSVLGQFNASTTSASKSGQSASGQGKTDSQTQPSANSNPGSGNTKTGQDKGTSDTSLDLGIGNFFATGQAARELGKGIYASLCNKGKNQGNPGGQQDGTKSNPTDGTQKQADVNQPAGLGTATREMAARQ
jgi:hypothetical protein